MGAIDVGTNSIRLIVAEASADGSSAASCSGIYRSRPAH